MVTAAQVILEYVCPILGVLLSNFMFIAPIADLQECVDKVGDLESLNPTPWAFMLGNCLGWTAYAIVANDLYVFFADFPGFLIACWLNLGAVKLLYSSHHQKETRRSLVEYLAHKDKEQHQEIQRVSASVTRRVSQTVSQHLQQRRTSSQIPHITDSDLMRCEQAKRKSQEEVQKMLEEDDDDEEDPKKDPVVEADTTEEGKGLNGTNEGDVTANGTETLGRSNNLSKEHSITITGRESDEFVDRSNELSKEQSITITGNGGSSDTFGRSGMPSNEASITIPGRDGDGWGDHSSKRSRFANSVSVDFAAPDKLETVYDDDDNNSASENNHHDNNNESSSKFHGSLFNMSFFHLSRNLRRPSWAKQKSQKIRQWGDVVWDVTSQKTPAKTPHEKLIMFFVLVWAVFLSALGFFNHYAPESVDAAAVTQSAVGWTVNVNNVFFFGAPLSCIGRVLKTRKSDEIHFPLMVRGMLSNALWTAYAVAPQINDPYLYVPTSLGLLFGFLQLALYLIFPRSENRGVDRQHSLSSIVSKSFLSDIFRASDRNVTEKTQNVGLVAVGEDSEMEMHGNAGSSAHEDGIKNTESANNHSLTEKMLENSNKELTRPTYSQSMSSSRYLFGAL